MIYFPDLNEIWPARCSSHINAPKSLIQALAKIEKALLRLLSAWDSLINIQLLNFTIKPHSHQQNVFN